MQIIGQAPEKLAAGSPYVMTRLKQYMGLLPKDEIESETTEGDLFAVRADSALKAEHAIVWDAVQRLLDVEQQRIEAYNATPRSDANRNQIEANARDCIKAIGEDLYKQAGDRAAKVRLAHFERQIDLRLPGRQDEDRLWTYSRMLSHLADRMKFWGVQYNREQAFDLLLASSASDTSYYHHLEERTVALVERHAKQAPLTGGERWVVHRLRCIAMDQPPMGVMPDLVSRLSKLLDGDAVYLLVAGEHWVDAIHADLASEPASKLQSWVAVLRHALEANASKSSAKWQQAAVPLLKAIGEDAFRERVTQWFSQVPRGKSVRMLGSSEWDTRGGADTINDGNATTLRGLVWMFTFLMDQSSPRTMADLLTTAIKKVPGVGPRAVKVANACVWALGEMAASDDEQTRLNALGQLARLKARVTFKTTLKAIAKALDKAAEKAGVSREDLEELGVPAFGFEDGVLDERLGDASVRLCVDKNKVVTQWTNAKGKVVKSAPASVRRDFKDEVKDLKQAAKDAEGMLLAGRERLDNIFLQDKSWPIADWRERYLDHGLLGTIASRLIWLVDETPVVFQDGAMQDVAGKPVKAAGTAQVRLWHPAGRDEEEIVDWRQRLEELKITQPFKQAHREVYLLTDAERNTGVYSNRYASHILKQHQFNALCGARRWNNMLRLMVDDTYPPAEISLPAFGLRAEFWVEGVGEEYGSDTNDSGVYLYLATDQVRFYRDAAAANWAHAGGGGYTTEAAGPGEENINEPIPLDQIDPLAFSEVMRDVDLFVGVASVGNDPNWEDGGPEGRYRDYWHSVSFGDLGATAQTRKQILERLVPRLKIADRCSFDDKFLVVRGDRRTYKIHLGSSNILMEPNDQYLCIVAGRGETKVGEKVFLPFEGDQRLAIILSKAMMLAEDTKIKDQTILSQIGR